MRSPDVDRIMEQVKDRTGYPVTVSFQDDMSEHSRMQSATEGAPGHIVLLIASNSGKKTARKA